MKLLKTYFNRFITLFKKIFSKNKKFGKKEFKRKIFIKQNNQLPSIKKISKKTSTKKNYYKLPISNDMIINKLKKIMGETEYFYEEQEEKNDELSNINENFNENEKKIINDNENIVDSYITYIKNTKAVIKRNTNIKGQIKKEVFNNGTKLINALKEQSIISEELAQILEDLLIFLI